nr:tail fiber protein [Citrobacter koseri]
MNDNANSRVPSSRKVNNRALNADITLSAGDVDAVSASNGGVFNKTVRFNEGLTLRGNEVGDAGMVGIHPGADAASFTGANLLLESWYGIGFYSSFPADAPRGIIGYIDVRSGRLEMKEQVIPGNYANFDARYQAKGSYTPAGQAYTKAESDGRFQPKGSYTPAGQAYTKAESDSRFNLKNTANKAANGWEKDASTGMITQWGSGTYSKNARITFPVAFPNGCMVVVGNDTGSGVVGTALGTKDKTGFTMYANSTTVSLNWIAKGY